MIDENMINQTKNQAREIATAIEPNVIINWM